MSLNETLKRAALERPSSQWLVIGDVVFATSDFFFRDGDERPVAVVKEDYNGVGHWLFMDRADIERRHRMTCKGACDEARCRHAP